MSQKTVMMKQSVRTESFGDPSPISRTGTEISLVKETQNEADDPFKNMTSQNHNLSEDSNEFN